MATTPKTVVVEAELQMRLSDHALRVMNALEANKGVVLPAINQLMAEAWAEGYQAEDASIDDNPYTKEH